MRAPINPLPRKFKNLSPDPSTPPPQTPYNGLYNPINPYTLMKPINEMSLQECLNLLRKERMPIEIDGSMYHGLFDHEDRIAIADRIESLTRWIPVQERWPEVEDVRGDKVLVYSTCGRYWKTLDGPEGV